MSAAHARPKPVAQLGAAYDAFNAGNYDAAYATAARIDRKHLRNADYALYVLAQSAFLTDRAKLALNWFRALLRRGGSRFRPVARWRIADCLWQLGRRDAARKAYVRLVNRASSQPAGDVGLARFRIAAVYQHNGNTAQAIRGYRRFLRRHPSHPLSDRADRALLELGGERAARLTDTEHIARAARLTDAHKWHRAIAELSLIADTAPANIRLRRDYDYAMTLFKMRQRYGDAGTILLRIYRRLGPSAADALFHGARAMSRVDRDKLAIKNYLKLVRRYPTSTRAPEALFLAGWLEFNLGNYRLGIPHLRRVLRRYRQSRWATSARWFLGLSHLLLGEHKRAERHFAVLAERRGWSKGGKGNYWLGRARQLQGKNRSALTAYRATVRRFPFSWYAILARARGKQLGATIGPFGGKPRRGPIRPIATDSAGNKVSDGALRIADELLDAGMRVEAGYELRRRETSYLRRHKSGAAMAALLSRYRRANDFHRPWMIAIVYGGKNALRSAPRGVVKRWWRHAYPLAYNQLVERWRHEGDNPKYYLQAIMRRESGFDRHNLSYADAIGLLQMIPPTTKKVAAEIGIEYSRDKLYDPATNIRTASWYIGRLLAKFRNQIPVASASYNSGPTPVMRWLDKHGHRPIDEYVELVPYRQTREYGKMVTADYARYLYLYAGTLYEQPLAINRNYVKDDLTY